MRAQPGRHREAADELAQRLAAGGDARPREQVGEELRRDRVGELARHRKPEPADLQQQLAHVLAV